MRLLIARLAAAVCLTAAAGVGVVVAATPATAAGCTGQSGVTVVVDPGSLGGDVQQVCDPSAGGRATGLFEESDFSLTYVQRQPGFVCRVNGLPASDPCVNTPPADAYWGLWWSDGQSGSWSYASSSAGSLTVPEGGYVAFAWQSGSKAPPGVPATAHTSTPTPSATPTQAPTASGGASSGGQSGGHGGGSGHSSPPSSKPSSRPTPSSASPTSASASGTPSAGSSGTPSASPTTKGHGGKHRTPSATPTPSSSSLTSPTTDAASLAASPEARSDVEASDEGTALPVWVVPLVILVLGAGASAIYVKRRRNRPSP